MPPEGGLVPVDRTTVLKVGVARKVAREGKRGDQREDTNGRRVGLTLEGLLVRIGKGSGRRARRLSRELTKESRVYVTDQ